MLLNSITRQISEMFAYVIKDIVNDIENITHFRVPINNYLE